MFGGNANNHAFRCYMMIPWRTAAPVVGDLCVPKGERATTRVAPTILSFQNNLRGPVPEFFFAGIHKRLNFLMLA